MFISTGACQLLCSTCAHSWLTNEHVSHLCGHLPQGPLGSSQLGVCHQLSHIVGQPLHEEGHMPTIQGPQAVALHRCTHAMEDAPLYLPSLHRAQMVRCMPAAGTTLLTLHSHTSQHGMPWLERVGHVLKGFGRIGSSSPFAVQKAHRRTQSSAELGTELSERIPVPCAGTSLVELL